MKIIDMHCDTISTLYDMNMSDDNVLKKNIIHVDIEKLKKGDYLLQNFACFVCLKQVIDSKERALELINFYKKQIRLNQDLIAPVLCYQDIIENEKSKKISSLLTLEEGSVVDNDLKNLEMYYQKGVRMITLTWNYANGIGYPNTKAKDDLSTKACKCLIENNEQSLYQNKGLTPFGILYIQKMEQLGMIIDVSHLSDAGFYDVIKYTNKPFVASHSNARSVCNVGRNLSDQMILALAKRRGVMGINFYGNFLQEGIEENMSSRVEDMIKHIKYIKNLAGIDVIGLGSDFDGIDSQLELKDASYLPILIDALRQENFKEEEIEKIVYKNVLRVYKEVL